MVKRRGVYRVLVGKPERKDHFEDLGVDGRIILRWIFIVAPCILRIH
jgi:hypothetical protein